MNKNVEEILNAQIEKEGYSSHLYLSMAIWAENNSFQGVSQWLYAQAEEEKMHMLKFIKYLTERGAKAVMPAIKQPPTEFTDIKKMFLAVREHEQYISNCINEIVAVCAAEKDYTTHSWVQWFVNEQIEEEASVNAIIDKINLIGDGNFYMFDRDIVGMRGQGSSASA